MARTRSMVPKCLNFNLIDDGISLYKAKNISIANESLTYTVCDIIHFFNCVKGKGKSVFIKKYSATLNH